MWAQLISTRLKPGREGDLGATGSSPAMVPVGTV
jgi:hypothetical protein